MRVLWAVKGLGPGGAERLLVSTAGSLAATAADLRVECVYVVARKDHLAGDLERLGVRTACLSTRHRDPSWPLRLAREIRSGRWDVVHLHSPLVAAVVRAATVGMRDRPALVTTEHNAWSTFRAPTRWANRWTSGRDDAILAVSEETAASLRGRAARRVVVVRHGIDVDAARAQRASRDLVRAELGLSSDDVVVCTVANFREQKDHPTMLRAFAELVARGVSFRAVVVGQGPLESETRALAADLGLETTVLFTGFRSDAVRVLAACDVFVLSSLWEGLPVALMEASALGIPIVSTAVGGVAEVVTDGVDGLLVAPGSPTLLADALGRVVCDGDLRHRLGDGAARLGAGFDVATSADTITATYRSVARSGGADASTPPATPRATPTRRPLPDGIDVRRADEDDTSAILDLMATTLGWVGPWAPRLFRWKHLENPFGASPMWVAVHQGQVVGVRAFLRWRFRRGDETLTAVRAVDTATRQDHRGAGLFTLLTLHALDEMREDGVDFVFNTPNDQSRPGYLKMGWVEVGRLPVSAVVRSPGALVTMARARQPAALETTPVRGGEPFETWFDRHRQPLARSADVRTIRTDADERFLAWRLGLPELDYRVVEAGSAAVVVRARRRGAALELVHAATFGDPVDETRALRTALRTTGAHHALSLGAARPAQGRVPVPRVGPILTWRSVTASVAAPLANWGLTMGDVELF